MHPHFVSPNHATQWFWRLLFLAALLILLFLLTYRVAAAQCIPNPTGETSVGLQNDSSLYLTFHIDGIRKDGVPTGDRSVDFVVTPGEHVLQLAVRVEPRSDFRIVREQRVIAQAQPLVSTVSAATPKSSAADTPWARPSGA